MARKYLMRAPGGETAEVDSSDVSHYRTLGAAVVGSVEDNLPGRGLPPPDLAPLPTTTLTPDEEQRRKIAGQKSLAQFAVGMPINFIPGGGAAGIIGRMGASYLAGAGADAGVDMFNRQRPNPQSMNTAGLWSAGGQGVGEGAGAIVSRMPQGLMMRGVGNQKQLTKEAMVAAGANPRFDVPDPSIIARQLLEEKVPIGPPIGGRANEAFRRVFGLPKGESGSQILNQRIGAARDAKVAALRDAGSRGKTYTVQDATRDLQLLRDELAKSEFPADEAALLEKHVKKFMDQHRVKLPNGRLGKFVRYTPEEFDTLRRSWDKVAEDLYVAGKAPVEPTARRREQRNATYASGARKRMIEDIPEVAAQNNKMRKLIPMRDATLVAEGRPVLNRTQLGIGTALGTAGGALTGGGQGAAMGAMTGAAMSQALSDPAIASRLALMFDSPVTQGIGRFSPRFALPFVDDPNRRASDR